MPVSQAALASTCGFGFSGAGGLSKSISFLFEAFLVTHHIINSDFSHDMKGDKMLFRFVQMIPGD